MKITGTSKCCRISLTASRPDEPSASWGTLLYEGSQELDSAPWTLLFPAGFLIATLAGFQMLGDELRDWLDVRRVPREEVG